MLWEPTFREKGLQMGRSKTSMTPQETQAYLEEGGAYTVATNGHDGWPHAVAMFCVIDPGHVVRFATYAKSQKVKNLESDPRVTVMRETGDAYEELKGVMIRGKAELIYDLDATIDTLIDALKASDAGDNLPADAKDNDAIRSVMTDRARKRVLVRVTPERVSSWDHTKMAAGSPNPGRPAG